MDARPQLRHGEGRCATGCTVVRDRRADLPAEGHFGFEKEGVQASLDHRVEALLLLSLTYLAQYAVDGTKAFWQASLRRTSELEERFRVYNRARNPDLPRTKRADGGLQAAVPSRSQSSNASRRNMQGWAEKGTRQVLLSAAERKEPGRSFPGPSDLGPADTTANTWCDRGGFFCCYQTRRFTTEVVIFWPTIVPYFCLRGQAAQPRN